MADYSKLPIKQFAPLPGRDTAETRYWQKFKFPVLVKEHAAISSLHFCPTSPYDFAVTSGARIQIYDSKNNTVRKTISRFKGVAYSGHFRNDGRLLVAGDDSGLIQVFDVASRSILRQFNGHNNAVHVSRFSPNGSQLVSASDDRTVKVWDVATGSTVMSWDDHSDYCRSAMACVNAPSLICSGSYDHTVKIHDLRETTQNCIMSIDHGAPVESIAVFPSATILVSAGGNEVKVWDILSGGKLLRTLSNHQKTVTSLCFNASYTRLLTGSLDHHLKIYDVGDYQVVHSMKYSSPILSVALSADDAHLATGMSNGLLSLKERKSGALSDEQEDKIKTPQTKDDLLNWSFSRPMTSKEGPPGNTYKYFLRGTAALPSENDIHVQHAKKPRLRAYDIFLRKFQYRQALDAALSNKDVRPVTIISLLEELLRRDGLKIAISGRNETTLEPLLQFLLKNATNPRFSSIVIFVLHLVLDVYSSIVGQSMMIDELLLKLKSKLDQEIRLQQHLGEVLGAMELLFSVSNSICT